MNEDFDYNNMKYRYEKENLSDIFRTMVDIYPSVSKPTISGQINLWELLQKIKYNFADEVKLFVIQNPKFLNGRKNEIYDEHKETLPAVCYNANFNGYKSLDHLISVTNLMFLDIDNFRSRKEASEFKDFITSKYDWIVACNLSLSGIGLHIIIQVDRIISNDDFNFKYDYISSKYFNGRLDKDSKSLTRYTILPFDYNIYVNETPGILNIDEIITRKKESISSGYIQTDCTSSESNNISIVKKENENLSIEKECIRSGYNIVDVISNQNHTSIGHNNLSDDEKGISSEYEREAISTEYTFLMDSPLKQIMNDSARKDNLVFKQVIDESFFIDPNIPVYYPSGIDIIKINIFPFHARKVTERRTFTIGALTVQMIYLNAYLPGNSNPEIKDAILKYILSVNKKICDPPMTYKKVMDSFNGNWKRYEAGELDFSKFFIKQRSFWSRECTLKGNEKRKVTCRIKNEPAVAESKRKIREAIEAIKTGGEKITQKKVALVSGLKLPTIKKYRNYYKEMVLVSNSTILNRGEVTTIDDINPVDNEIASYSDALEARNELASPSVSRDIPFKESEIAMEIENVGNIIFDPVAIKDDSKTILSDDQYRLIFDRVYNSFKNRLEKIEEKELFTKFMEKFNQMPEDDAILLAKPIDSIKDSDTFFKQAALDSKFWNLLPTM